MRLEQIYVEQGTGKSKRRYGEKMVVEEKKWLSRWREGGGIYSPGGETELSKENVLH